MRSCATPSANSILPQLSHRDPFGSPLAREAHTWRRWITALVAGPLAQLIHRADASALTHPSSLAALWRGAVRESAWRVLLNGARERLLDGSRTRDCLTVTLPQAAIALPLARFGAFELDWPAELDQLDDPRLDDPLALIDLITHREALPSPERARVRAELLDSILNLAQARLALRLRLALASRPQPPHDPRLDDPEHFVTDGHPWHPMNRTRLGLTRAQVVRYASEQLALTPVCCLEIEASLARVAGTYLDESPRWFGPATPGFVRIPIHPVQRHRLAKLFPSLWAQALLRPVDRPPIPCRSLLSLRTVALAPERHLKLACNVLTTSTRRIVSPMSVHNGPEVTRLILEIQRRDPITAPLQLLAEPAAAGLEPERVGEHASELGAILRAAPSSDDGARAWVCAAIGERWPGTEELVLERAAVGYPGGRRERIAALLDDWIAQLVPPSLRLFAAYGVVLELHLQNTLIRVLDGRAAGFCVRDLGGIRIHAPRLAAAQLTRQPRFAEGSFIITEDLDEVRGKLEHTLFHAHFAHLFGVAATLGVDEASSWANLRGWIERSLNTWAGAPQTPADLRARMHDDLRQLTRPQVRAKALLRMRLRERSSDYDYVDVANALAPEPALD